MNTKPKSSQSSTFIAGALGPRREGRGKCYSHCFLPSLFSESQDSKLLIKKNMTRLERMKKAKNHEFNCYLGAAVLGFLAGVILATTLFRAKREVPSEPIVQEIKAVEPQRFCGDVISYIRCRGEDLGVSNQNIMTMIRIAKCESGLREDAYNKNRNGTIDGGVFQINSVHKVALKNVFDYQYNIDYAYKLFLAQGFNPWSASRKCWSK